MTKRKLLRLPAVCEVTGLKRDSIYRLAKAGIFPKPVRISDRASGWIETEVQEFIKRRIAARDGSLAPRA